ncbi:MAG: hypothetical protein GF335_03795 [Candidatus Moranbacteria bacterium]|nr:hypothetical protein [Candidatus Moranbacteria bacterium]
MIYDTIIIGAGPAGLTAAIYASRYFLSALVIGEKLGGTMSDAHRIENYPGFESISGMELANKMLEQAKSLSAQFVFSSVKRIQRTEKGIFKITTGLTKEEHVFQAHSIIIASGMKRRVLGIQGEKKLLGKGVSYCSTCDAAFFKDKTVAVIGGANAATMSAVHLSQYARKVYLIYRKDRLRGEPTWNKRAVDNDKVKVIFNTNITEIKGENVVKGVELDKEFNGKKELTLDGVFIEIGHLPIKEMAVQLGLELSKKGFIKVDANKKTNIPGVLAAGDITDRKDDFRQVVTAVSDGAIAAKSAFDLKTKKDKITQPDIDYR